MNVYVVGNDGNVWTSGWDGSSWSNWNSLRGPSAASTPSAASWGPDRIDMFVGGADRALWHNW